MKTLSPLKFFQILVACLLLDAPVLAQHRWGVGVGPNLSSLHHASSSPSDPRIGFNINGIYELTLNGRFGFQTGLGYVLAGTKGTDENVNLHYLMIPATIHYAVVKWLKLSAGGQGGILLSDNSGMDYRTVDAGVTAGVEVMLKENLSIQVSNYFGLVYDRLDASDYYRYVNGDDPLVIDPDTDNDPIKVNRNNIFQINLRYYFPTRTH